MRSGFSAMDTLRVNEADRATEATTKSARQKARNSKRRVRDNEEKAADTDYDANLH